MMTLTSNSFLRNFDHKFLVSSNIRKISGWNRLTVSNQAKKSYSVGQTSPEIRNRGICDQSINRTYTYRVPTRTGKPGKMGRHFPVREKSGNFEQTGKVREKSGNFVSPEKWEP